MTFKPLVSVVVPVYNVEEWLGACLQSVIDQSYGQWEALVVVDGSTDGSAAIAHRFAALDPRITVLEFENGGIGRARNRGLDASTGRYVTFVDSDDLLPVGALESYVSLLDETGSDIVTGKAEQLRADGTLGLYWTMSSRLHASAAKRRTTVHDEPLLILDHTTWNKAYRRSFLIDNGIRYPEDTVLGEDVVHSVTAYLAATSVDVVPEVVYRHRRRPGSVTTELMHGRVIEDWVSQTTVAFERILATGDAAVLDEYLLRMLRSEAWTRAQRFDELDDAAHTRQVRELFGRLVEAASPAVRAALPASRIWAYRAFMLGEDVVATLATADLPLAAIDTRTLEALHASQLGVQPAVLTAELWRSTSLRTWVWARGGRALEEASEALDVELAAADKVIATWTRRDRRAVATIRSGTAEERERLRTLLREAKTGQLDHFDEGRLRYFVHLVVHRNLGPVIDRAVLQVRSADGVMHNVAELDIRRDHMRKVILTGSFVKLRWRARHAGGALALTLWSGEHSVEVPLELATNAPGVLSADAAGISVAGPRKESAA